MKKIIDGKRYDTETATKIAGWSNNLGSRDFHNCSEDLYKTKSGNWFIYGEGGPMTNYATSCGNNSYCGGEDICPMTPEEAQIWLETHNFVGELEEHFSNKIVDA
jgi:hypothetical protein